MGMKKKPESGTGGRTQFPENLGFLKMFLSHMTFKEYEQCLLIIEARGIRLRLNKISRLVGA